MRLRIYLLSMELFPLYKYELPPLFCALYLRLPIYLLRKCFPLYKYAVTSLILCSKIAFANIVIQMNMELPPLYSTIAFANILIKYGVASLI